MLLPDAAVDRIARAAEAFCAIAEKDTPKPVLDVIARIDIAAGKIELQLKAKAIAEAIDVDVEEIAAEVSAASPPFQLRKRGVETKMILGDDPTTVDEVLVRNIAVANAWFERIKAGETVAQIAATEATSKRRIQQMIGLALLAPDVVRDVMDGDQPTGFTSDWCKNHELPSNWTGQRALIATL